MMTREIVRETVVEVLLGFMDPGSAPIEDHHKILTDLDLSSDDASAFALLAARRIGATVPVRAWSSVSTVGEAVDLLWSYVGTK